MDTRRVSWPGPIRLIALLFALLVVLVMPTAARAASEFARAQAAVEAGRLKEALPLLDAAIAAEPARAGAYLLRGIVRFELKQWDPALADYEAALRLDPGNAEAWYRRGYWWAADAKDRKALPDYERSIALDPVNTRYLYARATAYERLRDWRRAAEAYQAVLLVDPTHADATRDLKDVREKLGPAAAGVPAVSGVPSVPAAAAVASVAGDDPAGVVQALLEAQARGDVEGVLALVATEGIGERGVALARAGFTVVARKARISGLQVKVRASRVGAAGRAAVVRVAFEARVSASGEDGDEAGGLLAVLVRERGSWRVRALYPDDLLAIEALGVRERRTASNDWLPVVHAADLPWVDVERLNQALDRAVLTTVIDEHKLLQDSHGSAVGAIPGVGDVLSAGYTLLDRYRTAFHELPQDFRDGNVEATLTDIGLLGWGVVQVVAEPIPIVDHAVDLVGAGLDQWKYNRTQKQAFLRLRAALLARDYRAHPKFLVFRDFEGLPVDARGLYELTPGPELAGKAVRSFALLSDTPARTGARARFEVGVEVRIHASESEVLFEAARMLKVPTRSIAASAPHFKPDFVALIPVRLPGAARDVFIDGPEIGLEPTLAEGVSWRFGCTRGLQTVQVALADGTRTEPLVFENRAFNEVKGIRVRRSSDGQTVDAITLREGEAIDGLEVIGIVGGEGVEALGPLLTGSPCSRVSVGDPLVVDLRAEGRWPQARLGLTGRSAGATRLTVIVGSGSLAVEKAFGHVPIEVIGKAPAPPNLEGEWWMEATVERATDPGGSPADSGRVRFREGHFEMWGPDESGEERWLDFGTYAARPEGGRIKILVTWFNAMSRDRQSWSFDLAPGAGVLQGTFSASSRIGSEQQEMSGRVSFRR